MDLFMPYHAGLVVPDVPAAIGDLEARLGCTFNEPTRLTVHEAEDRLGGVTGPLEMVVAYSRDRPFRLELIECQGVGIYSAANQGLHHLGVWEPDPAGRLKRLEEAGDPVDAVFRQRDGAISVIYARSAMVPGQRIEYVNEAQRERLERWFDTGILS
ncbi:MAG TPA: VOC family protein [Amycolatopsis sp.]|nr:VOC family protein [Amycolatopsis sp.]